MKLMHILIDDRRGGCERDCLMLCTELPEVSHVVVYLGAEGEMMEDFRKTGARVIYLDVQTRWSWHRIAVLRRTAGLVNPAGVIIWHGLVYLPFLLFALRPFRVPTLVHGGNPAFSIRTLVDWKYRILAMLLPVQTLPLYVCCSRHVADSFHSSRYLRRFPRVVQLNGVELVSGILHEPRDFDPSSPFTIGMLARFDPVKDHATLLQAFAIVRNRFPCCRLELAGSGRAEVEIRSLAARLSLGDSVRFLGMVNDVYTTMRKWDLFTYSTTVEEGFGNAVAEAMMLGLP
jgi:glycosyltransferase involved in cell wall biosynthesis